MTTTIGDAPLPMLLYILAMGVGAMAWDVYCFVTIGRPESIRQPRASQQRMYTAVAALEPTT